MVVFRDFCDVERSQFDTSKISELHDSLKYDFLHNRIFVQSKTFAFNPLLYFVLIKLIQIYSEHYTISQNYSFLALVPMNMVFQQKKNWILAC